MFATIRPAGFIGCVLLASLACSDSSPTPRPPSIQDGRWERILDGRKVRAVSGTPPYPVYAVGEGGLALVDEGSGWTELPTATDADLYAVSVAPSGHVFAAGDDGTVLRLDGETWTTLRSRAGARLEAIWAFSANDVFVGGLNAQLLRFENGVWSSLVEDGYGEIRGIWGSSPGDVFAVGDLELTATVLHHDGTVTTRMTIPEVHGLRLNGIWGTSGADVFAVGDDNAILHYDGASWQVQRPPDPYGGKAASAVSGTGPGDVFAVGSDILHYDGTTWELVRGDVSLRSLWVASPSRALAVGWDSALRLDGAEWFEEPSLLRPTFRAVWDDGESAFAVGRKGVVARRVGGTWAPLESGTRADLNAVWGSSGADVHAVGGTLLHYDGTRWSVASGYSVPDYSPMQVVWGASPRDVFAGAPLLRFDGTTWRLDSAFAGGLVVGLSGTSPSDVFAATGSCLLTGPAPSPGTPAPGFWPECDWQLSRWDGSAWQRVAGASKVIGKRLEGVWVGGPALGYAWFNDGDTWLDRSRGWAPAPAPARPIKSVCSSSGVIVAATYGELFVDEGTGWLRLSPPPAAGHVFCGASRAVYLVTWEPAGSVWRLSW